MSKASARREWKRSCVVRHLLAFIEDSARAAMICLKGGGLVGGVQYPAVSLPERREERVIRQLCEVKRWADVALAQVGVDVKKADYLLNKRERDLINAKVMRINRYMKEQALDTWREIRITLAALNLALFWARQALGDTPQRRMVFIEVDKLCLMLGDGADWMLAMDFYDFCRDSILDGMPPTGLTSEEEWFFRVLAMPAPRTDTERALIEDDGGVAETVALLSA